MEVLYRIICILLGYLFGLIQTAYILGKMKGIDIRNYGSGNAGMTNATRVLGKKAGAVCYIGDCLKAIVAALLVHLIFHNLVSESLLGLLIFYCGLGVVLGHNFPFYMNFKGGKGIAATSGAVIAFGDWRIIVACLIVFFAVLLTTKYVSLGSLCVVSTFFITTIIFGCLGKIGFKGQQIDHTNLIETIVVAFLFTLLAFVRHRANIVRLVQGTERKIGEKKSIA